MNTHSRTITRYYVREGFGPVDETWNPCGVSVKSLEVELERTAGRQAVEEAREKARLIRRILRLQGQL